MGTAARLTPRRSTWLRHPAPQSRTSRPSEVTSSSSLARDVLHTTSLRRRSWHATCLNRLRQHVSLGTRSAHFSTQQRLAQPSRGEPRSGGSRRRLRGSVVLCCGRGQIHGSLGQLAHFTSTWQQTCFTSNLRANSNNIDNFVGSTQLGTSNALTKLSQRQKLAQAVLKLSDDRVWKYLHPTFRSFTLRVGYGNSAVPKTKG